MIEGQLVFDAKKQERRKRLEEVVSSVSFATLFGGLGCALIHSIPLITPEGRESFSLYKTAVDAAGTAAEFGGGMYIAFKIQDAYRRIMNRRDST